MYTLQNKYMKNLLRLQAAQMLRLLQNDFITLECGEKKNSAGSMKSNFLTFHLFVYMRWPIRILLYSIYIFPQIMRKVKTKVSSISRKKAYLDNV